MNIGLYMYIIKNAFLQGMVYKANLAFSILSSLMGIFVRISLWYALTGIGNTAVNTTFGDMMNYVVIITIVLSLTDSDIGKILGKKIEDGTIGNDLVKPVILKHYLFADCIGRNWFRTLFETLPVCLIAAIFFGLKMPDEFLRTTLFVTGLLAGIVIIFEINYLTGMLAFWLKTSWYINWYISGLFKLFGGTFVPLWFYPKFLYDISSVLPFRFIIFEPISVYLGKTAIIQGYHMLLYQVLWIILLNASGKLVWKLAQKRIFIHGG